MPRMEVHSKTRKGFRPPAVSTQGANGILRNDPESDGIATRNPTCSGVSPRVCLMAAAVGPNNATAAKPIKNPSVAPNKPCAGGPLIFIIFPSQFSACQSKHHDYAKLRIRAVL